jgi:hypothetical protein
MPAFIHNRAEHILAKNPSMGKSMAFAIATQQSHALGKSPKGYGTAEGKAEAKKKYDGPKKDYKKSANPGDLQSPKMEKKALDAVMLNAFSSELEAIMKEAGLGQFLMQEIPGTKPWIIGNSQVISRGAKPAASAAGKAVMRSGLRTGQTANGAWDVSRQAAAMGL